MLKHGLLLIFLFCYFAHGTTVTWKSCDSGRFIDGFNWDVSVPTAEDTVVFPECPSSITVTFLSATTLKNVHLNSNVVLGAPSASTVLTITGDFIWNGGTIGLSLVISGSSSSISLASDATHLIRQGASVIVWGQMTTSCDTQCLINFELSSRLQLAQGSKCTITSPLLLTQIVQGPLSQSARFLHNAGRPGGPTNEPLQFNIPNNGVADFQIESELPDHTGIYSGIVKIRRGTIGGDLRIYNDGILDVDGTVTQPTSGIITSPSNGNGGILLSSNADFFVSGTIVLQRPTAFISGGKITMISSTGGEVRMPFEPIPENSGIIIAQNGRFDFRGVDLVLNGGFVDVLSGSTVVGKIANLYINHPLSVFRILNTVTCTTNAITCSLIHRCDSALGFINVEMITGTLQISHPSPSHVTIEKLTLKSSEGLPIPTVHQLQKGILSITNEFKWESGILRGPGRFTLCPGSNTLITTTGSKMLTGTGGFLSNGNLEFDLNNSSVVADRGCTIQAADSSRTVFKSSAVFATSHVGNFPPRLLLQGDIEFNFENNDYFAVYWSFSSFKQINFPKGTMNVYGDDSEFFERFNSGDESNSELNIYSSSFTFRQQCMYSGIGPITIYPGANALYRGIFNTPTLLTIKSGASFTFTGSVEQLNLFPLEGTLTFGNIRGSQLTMQHFDFEIFNGKFIVESFVSWRELRTATIYQRGVDSLISIGNEVLARSIHFEFIDLEDGKIDFNFIDPTIVEYLYLNSSFIGGPLPVINLLDSNELLVTKYFSWKSGGVGGSGTLSVERTATANIHTIQEKRLFASAAFLALGTVTIDDPCDIIGELGSYIQIGTNTEFNINADTNFISDTTTPFQPRLMNQGIFNVNSTVRISFRVMNFWDLNVFEGFDLFIEKVVDLSQNENYQRINLAKNSNLHVSAPLSIFRNSLIQGEGVLHLLTGADVSISGVFSVNGGLFVDGGRMIFQDGSLATVFDLLSCNSGGSVIFGSASRCSPPSSSLIITGGSFTARQGALFTPNTILLNQLSGSSSFEFNSNSQPLRFSSIIMRDGTLLLDTDQIITTNLLVYNSGVANGRSVVQINNLAAWESGNISHSILIRTSAEMFINSSAQHVFLGELLENQGKVTAEHLILQKLPNRPQNIVRNLKDWTFFSNFVRISKDSQLINDGSDAKMVMNSIVLDAAFSMSNPTLTSFYGDFISSGELTITGKVTFTSRVRLFILPSSTFYIDHCEFHLYAQVSLLYGIWNTIGTETVINVWNQSPTFWSSSSLIGDGSIVPQGSSSSTITIMGRYSMNGNISLTVGSLLFRGAKVRGISGISAKGGSTIEFSNVEFDDCFYYLHYLTFELSTFIMKDCIRGSFEADLFIVYRSTVLITNSGCPTSRFVFNDVDVAAYSSNPRSFLTMSELKTGFDIGELVVERSTVNFGSTSDTLSSIVRRVELKLRSDFIVDKFYNPITVGAAQLDYYNCVFSFNDTRDLFIGNITVTDGNNHPQVLRFTNIAGSLTFGWARSLYPLINFLIRNVTGAVSFEEYHSRNSKLTVDLVDSLEMGIVSLAGSSNYNSDILVSRLNNCFTSANNITMGERSLMDVKNVACVVLNHTIQNGQRRTSSTNRPSNIRILTVTGAVIFNKAELRENAHITADIVDSFHFGNLNATYTSSSYRKHIQITDVTKCFSANYMFIEQTLTVTRANCVDLGYTEVTNSDGQLTLDVITTTTQLNDTVLHDRGTLTITRTRDFLSNYLSMHTSYSYFDLLQATHSAFLNHSEFRNSARFYMNRSQNYTVNTLITYNQSLVHFAEYSDSFTAKNLTMLGTSNGLRVLNGGDVYVSYSYHARRSNMRFNGGDLLTWGKMETQSDSSKTDQVVLIENFTRNMTIDSIEINGLRLNFQDCLRNVTINSLITTGGSILVSNVNNHFTLKNAFTANNVDLYVENVGSTSLVSINLYSSLVSLVNTGFSFLSNILIDQSSTLSINTPSVVQLGLIQLCGKLEYANIIQGQDIWFYSGEFTGTGLLRANNIFISSSADKFVRQRAQIEAKFVDIVPNSGSIYGDRDDIVFTVTDLLSVSGSASFLTSSNWAETRMPVLRILNKIYFDWDTTEHTINWRLELAPNAELHHPTSSLFLSGSSRIDGKIFGPGALLHPDLNPEYFVFKFSQDETVSTCVRASGYAVITYESSVPPACNVLSDLAQITCVDTENLDAFASEIDLLCNTVHNDTTLCTDDLSSVSCLDLSNSLDLWTDTCQQLTTWVEINREESLEGHHHQCNPSVSLTPRNQSVEASICDSEDSNVLYCRKWLKNFSNGDSSIVLTYPDVISEDSFIKIINYTASSQYDIIASIDYLSAYATPTTPIYSEMTSFGRLNHVYSPTSVYNSDAISLQITHSNTLVLIQGIYKGSNDIHINHGNLTFDGARLDLHTARTTDNGNIVFTNISPLPNSLLDIQYIEAVSGSISFFLVGTPSSPLPIYDILMDSGNVSISFSRIDVTEMSMVKTSAKLFVINSVINVDRFRFTEGQIHGPDIAQSRNNHFYNHITVNILSIMLIRMDTRFYGSHGALVVISANSELQLPNEFRALLTGCSSSNCNPVPTLRNFGIIKLHRVPEMRWLLDNQGIIWILPNGFFQQTVNAQCSSCTWIVDQNAQFLISARYDFGSEANITGPQGTFAVANGGEVFFSGTYDVRPHIDVSSGYLQFRPDAQFNISSVSVNQGSLIFESTSQEDPDTWNSDKVEVRNGNLKYSNLDKFLFIEDLFLSGGLIELENLEHGFDAEKMELIGGTLRLSAFKNPLSLRYLEVNGATVDLRTGHDLTVDTVIVKGNSRIIGTDKLIVKNYFEFTGGRIEVSRVELNNDAVIYGPTEKIIHSNTISTANLVLGVPKVSSDLLQNSPDDTIIHFAPGSFLHVSSGSLLVTGTTTLTRLNSNSVAPYLRVDIPFTVQDSIFNLCINYNLPVDLYYDVISSQMHFCAVHTISGTINFDELSSLRVTGNVNFDITSFVKGSSVVPHVFEGGFTANIHNKFQMSHNFLVRSGSLTVHSTATYELEQVFLDHTNANMKVITPPQNLIITRFKSNGHFTLESVTKTLTFNDFFETTAGSFNIIISNELITFTTKVDSSDTALLFQDVTNHVQFEVPIDILRGSFHMIRVSSHFSESITTTGTHVWFNYVPNGNYIFWKSVGGTVRLENMIILETPDMELRNLGTSYFNDVTNNVQIPKWLISGCSNLSIGKIALLHHIDEINISSSTVLFHEIPNIDITSSIVRSNSHVTINHCDDIKINSWDQITGSYTVQDFNDLFVSTLLGQTLTMNVLDGKIVLIEDLSITKLFNFATRRVNPRVHLPLTYLQSDQSNSKFEFENINLLVLDSFEATSPTYSTALLSECMNTELENITMTGIDWTMTNSAFAPERLWWTQSIITSTSHPNPIIKPNYLWWYSGFLGVNTHMHIMKRGWITSSGLKTLRSNSHLEIHCPVEWNQLPQNSGGNINGFSATLHVQPTGDLTIRGNPALTGGDASHSDFIVNGGRVRHVECTLDFSYFWRFLLHNGGKYYVQCSINYIINHIGFGRCVGSVDNESVFTLWDNSALRVHRTSFNVESYCTIQGPETSFIQMTNDYRTSWTIHAHGTVNVSNQWHFPTGGNLLIEPLSRPVVKNITIYNGFVSILSPALNLEDLSYYCLDGTALIDGFTGTFEILDQINCHLELTTKQNQPVPTKSLNLHRSYLIGDDTLTISNSYSSYVSELQCSLILEDSCTSTQGTFVFQRPKSSIINNGDFTFERRFIPFDVFSYYEDDTNWFNNGNLLITDVVGMYRYNKNYTGDYPFIINDGYLTKRHAFDSAKRTYSHLHLTSNGNFTIEETSIFQLIGNFSRPENHLITGNLTIHHQGVLELWRDDLIATQTSGLIAPNSIDLESGQIKMLNQIVYAEFQGYWDLNMKFEQHFGNAVFSPTCTYNNDQFISTNNANFTIFPDEDSPIGDLSRMWLRHNSHVTFYNPTQDLYWKLIDQRQNSLLRVIDTIIGDVKSDIIDQSSGTAIYGDIIGSFINTEKMTVNGLWQINSISLDLDLNEIHVAGRFEVPYVGRSVIIRGGMFITNDIEYGFIGQDFRVEGGLHCYGGSLTIHTIGRNFTVDRIIAVNCKINVFQVNNSVFIHDSASINATNTLINFPSVVNDFEVIGTFDLFSNSVFFASPTNAYLHDQIIVLDSKMTFTELDGKLTAHHLLSTGVVEFSKISQSAKFQDLILQDGFLSILDTTTLYCQGFVTITSPESHHTIMNINNIYEFFPTNIWTVDGDVDIANVTQTVEFTLDVSLFSGIFSISELSNNLAFRSTLTSNGTFFISKISDSVIFNNLIIDELLSLSEVAKNFTSYGIAYVSGLVTSSHTDVFELIGEWFVSGEVNTQHIRDVQMSTQITLLFNSSFFISHVSQPITFNYPLVGYELSLFSLSNVAEFIHFKVPVDTAGELNFINILPGNSKVDGSLFAHTLVMKDVDNFAVDTTLTVINTTQITNTNHLRVPILLNLTGDSTIMTIINFDVPTFHTNGELNVMTVNNFNCFDILSIGTSSFNEIKSNILLNNLFIHGLLGFEIVTGSFIISAPVESPEGTLLVYEFDYFDSQNLELESLFIDDTSVVNVHGFLHVGGELSHVSNIQTYVKIEDELVVNYGELYFSIISEYFSCSRVDNSGYLYFHSINNVDLGSGVVSSDFSLLAALRITQDIMVKGSLSTWSLDFRHFHTLTVDGVFNVEGPSIIYNCTDILVEQDIIVGNYGAFWSDIDSNLHVPVSLTVPSHVNPTSSECFITLDTLAVNQTECHVVLINSVQGNVFLYNTSIDGYLHIRNTRDDVFSNLIQTVRGTLIVEDTGNLFTLPKLISTGRVVINGVDQFIVPSLLSHDDGAITVNRVYSTVTVESTYSPNGFLRFSMISPHLVIPEFHPLGGRVEFEQLYNNITVPSFNVTDGYVALYNHTIEPKFFVIDITGGELILSSLKTVYIQELNIIGGNRTGVDQAFVLDVYFSHGCVCGGFTSSVESMLVETNGDKYFAGALEFYDGTAFVTTDAAFIGLEHGQFVVSSEGMVMHGSQGTTVPYLFMLNSSMTTPSEYPPSFVFTVSFVIPLNCYSIITEWRLVNYAPVTVEAEETTVFVRRGGALISSDFILCPTCQLIIDPEVFVFPFRVEAAGHLIGPIPLDLRTVYSVFEVAGIWDMDRTQSFTVGNLTLLPGSNHTLDRLFLSGTYTFMWMNGTSHLDSTDNEGILTWFGEVSVTNGAFLQITNPATIVDLSSFELTDSYLLIDEVTLPFDIAFFTVDPGSTIEFKNFVSNLEMTGFQNLGTMIFNTLVPSTFTTLHFDSGIRLGMDEIYVENFRWTGGEFLEGLFTINDGQVHNDHVFYGGTVFKIVGRLSVVTNATFIPLQNSSVIIGNGGVFDIASEFATFYACPTDHHLRTSSPHSHLIEWKQHGVDCWPSEALFLIETNGTLHVSRAESMVDFMLFVDVSCWVEETIDPDSVDLQLCQLQWDSFVTHTAAVSTVSDVVIRLQYGSTYSGNWNLGPGSELILFHDEDFAFDSCSFLDGNEAHLLLTFPYQTVRIYGKYRLSPSITLYFGRFIFEPFSWAALSNIRVVGGDFLLDSVYPIDVDDIYPPTWRLADTSLEGEGTLVISTLPCNMSIDTIRLFQGELRLNMIPYVRHVKFVYLHGGTIYFNTGTDLSFTSVHILGDFGPAFAVGCDHLYMDFFEWAEGFVGDIDCAVEYHVLESSEIHGMGEKHLIGLTSIHLHPSNMFYNWRSRGPLYMCGDSRFIVYPDAILLVRSDVDLLPMEFGNTTCHSFSNSSSSLPVWQIEGTLDRRAGYLASIGVHFVTTSGSLLRIRRGVWNFQYSGLIAGEVDLWRGTTMSFWPLVDWVTDFEFTSTSHIYEDLEGIDPFTAKFVIRMPITVLVAGRFNLSDAVSVDQGVLRFVTTSLVHMEKAHVFFNGLIEFFSDAYQMDLVQLECGPGGAVDLTSGLQHNIRNLHMFGCYRYGSDHITVSEELLWRERGFNDTGSVTVLGHAQISGSEAKTLFHDSCVILSGSANLNSDGPVSLDENAVLEVANEGVLNIESRAELVYNKKNLEPSRYNLVINGTVIVSSPIVEVHNHLFTFVDSFGEIILDSGVPLEEDEEEEE
ncbi:hypothetical protein RCL1_000091 [Eukaryota sp. TZLM3-RCL]